MMIQHKNLTEERWQKFSLAEQLGNVGSETSRALKWQGKDDVLWRGALGRAFELIDMTIADTRFCSRLKEIVRLREMLADAMFGGREYGSNLEDIDRYLFQFAFAARKSR
ncbi:MAG: hypothetical protein Q7R73_00515 [bacterium]|nr:hypothetical protein [bacterium]